MPVESINSTETCIPADTESGVQAIVPSAILKYTGSIVQWRGYVNIEETGRGITNLVILQLWRREQKNLYLLNTSWTAASDDITRIDPTHYNLTVNIDPAVNVQAGDTIGFFFPRLVQTTKPMEPLCYNSSTSNHTIFYTHSSSSRLTISLCDKSLSRLDNMQIQIQPVYGKLNL